MTQIIEITEPELSVSNKNELIVGIDLGTTNSLIAIIEENQARIIASISSVLSIKEQQFIVGEPPVGELPVKDLSVGKHLAGEAGSIYSIKKLMGKNFEDLDQATKNKYIFEKRIDKQLRIKLGEQFLSPEEISSKILLKLKYMAENYCNQPLKKVVITVPAYFDERSRMATKNAALLADLEVVRLLNEPTAAAVAYGLDGSNRGIYAVYDLGGGTFDASILNLTDGIFHVLATAGNTNFGGDDIDYKLYEYIKQKFLLTYSNQKLEAINDVHLIKKIKAAKELLSKEDSVKITIPIDDILAEISLSRLELEELILPEIKNTVNILRRCIKDSMVPVSEIKGIILVGGSSRLLLIKKLIKEIFNIHIFDNINPDTIVVQGAAMQAHNLSTSQGNVLLDVVPISLGIEVMGGLFERIIHRNSVTPISVSKDFTTYEDGQNAMSITVLQGEREMVKDCRVIGKFSVKNIPPALAGKVKITITFKIDADGLLTVEGFNKQTKELFKVEVNPNYGFSVHDMENMLRTSILNQEDDMKQKKILQSKFIAESFIQSLENSLNNRQLNIKEEQIIHISNKITLLKDLLKQEEMDIITQEISELKNSYYKILDLKYSL